MISINVSKNLSKKMPVRVYVLIFNICKIVVSHGQDPIVVFDDMFFVIVTLVHM